MNECIPSKIVTVRPNDKPWYDSGIRRFLMFKLFRWVVFVGIYVYSFMNKFKHRTLKKKNKFNMTVYCISNYYQSKYVILFCWSTYKCTLIQSVTRTQYDISYMKLNFILFILHNYTLVISFSYSRKLFYKIII